MEEVYVLRGPLVFYGVDDSVKVFARIDNLFDADYEEVPGYGTPGIGGYLGTKISF